MKKLNRSCSYREGTKQRELRYYSEEFDARLPKIFEFYEKYSKVFPNYVTIPENKFMFKNIERKQKFIDDKQRAIEEQNKRNQKEKQK